MIVTLKNRTFSFCLVLLLALQPTWSLSQVPITTSGLNTQVSDPIAIGQQIQYNITGGTRPGGGENLFHSFGQFNIPTDNIANFFNGVSFDLNGAALPPGLQTANILARVSSPNPSAIFGTLQTTGFNDTNLFLMNPSGIVFGPNAALNVGGSVTFTTADYLRLSNTNGPAGVFHADTAASSILTSAPVAAFGFATSTPAAIAVQGSRLSVSNGEALSLIGGNRGFDYIDRDTGRSATVPDGITIAHGRLSAASGQINLAGTTSQGELSAVDFTPTPGMTMGNIRLSHNTLLDVKANRAGTVRIRGGQLLMENATISADTTNANANSTAVDIQLTGDLSITAEHSPAITARTTGIGDAGKILIVSRNMDLTGITQDILSVIESQTSGTGKAGNVSIVTGDLHLTGDQEGLVFPINTGTLMKGHGGDITIKAENVTIDSAVIVTGDPSTGEVKAEGSAGNLTIASDTLKINASNFDVQSFIGKGGNVSITARDIRLTEGGIAATGATGSGKITIDATSLLHAIEYTIESVILDTGSGGGINVAGKSIELMQGSQFVTSTKGNGNAGPIQVTATDHLSMTSPSVFNRPSGIFSNAFGISGNAGTITIKTPRLDLTEGARINTVSKGSGFGGNVFVNANDILISGELPGTPSEAIFSLGNLLASGIFTSTIGTPTSCAGTCGGAGNVSISSGSLTMSNGGQINSGTSSTGQGGNVTTAASEQIALSGTLQDGSPVGIFSRSIGTASGAGSGGNISLTAGQSVKIQNGASVSASSTGPGNAGNISIDAGQQFEMQDSRVTTEANLASGGNIYIKAVDLIRVANSKISSSVQGGPSTAGGNITIDPKTVVLQNAQILADAQQGNGGNIEITTPLFLKDPTSNIDASSRFGVSGTVTVQSPTSNLSGTVGQLASKTNPPQVLLQNRCIALAGGEQSTFILAGRDALPSEPGGWLSSPIAMEHWTGEKPEEHVSRLMVRNRGWNTQPLLVVSKDKTTMLSLRRLTPPGFLVRSFATGTTGCPS